jgi:hypothetical protein
VFSDVLPPRLYMVHVALRVMLLSCICDRFDKKPATWKHNEPGVCSPSPAQLPSTFSASAKKEEEEVPQALQVPRQGRKLESAQFLEFNCPAHESPESSFNNVKDHGSAAHFRRERRRNEMKGFSRECFESENVDVFVRRHDTSCVHHIRGCTYLTNLKTQRTFDGSMYI